LKEFISDKNIVDGLVRSKEIVIQHVLDTYSARIYGVAFDYVKSKEVAEEITQDVFMTMIQKANSFNFKSSLSTWIYRMTVNKSLDFQKYQKRNKRSGRMVSLNDSNEDINIVNNSPDPETKLINMNKEQIILRAIDQLSENQKTAIILVRMEGIKQKEVAEIMNINVKALESLLQRGQKRLKEVLSDIYDQL
jgi:RNA polymerase sigma-70 factor (ECF subfamily)